MQINTLTITTEQVKAGKDLFKLTSFEQRTTAICDLCGFSADAAEKVLENRGWFLGRNEHFCPECNY